MSGSERQAPGTDRDVDVGGDELDRLLRARERFAEAEARIDDHGEDVVRATADAYERASDLLEDYVDRATGTGKENFKAYVELEGTFTSLVEGLPEDVDGREAFEEALEAIDKRRLSEEDFERAERALAPASEFSELLAEREEAREALASARTAAGRRLREIDDEIDERERLLDLADVDFDAPVERLEEPVAAYNERVREAFAAFRREASAREVFDLVDRSRLYPFVDYRRPPAELREYVRTNPAGEYTIPELLEYADYSRSKLAHYVDSADELKRRVATQQTYLDGIDAEPLTVDWPPAPAGVLRRRLRERRPFVERIADADAVARLRTVRDLAADDDYERLRRAAVGTAELAEEERERLATGAVEAELEALRRERERLEAALEEDDPV